MFNRMFGGVLLIMGTSIGGGMLALPIVTAQAGFVPAVLLMVGVWFFMTMGAFWLLEVNLYLPERNNLISMARATLGLPGQIVAWLSYLLLLYCLLSAYIAGGGDVTQHLLASLHVSLPYWLSAVVFILVCIFLCLCKSAVDLPIKSSGMVDFCWAFSNWRFCLPSSRHT